MEILGLGEINSYDFQAIIVVLGYVLGFQRKGQGQADVLRKRKTRENVDLVIRYMLFEKGKVPTRLYNVSGSL